jgi:hypothetical protein
MKSVNDTISELQARVFMYEVLFSSLFSEMPQAQLDAVIKNARQSFSSFESGTDFTEQSKEKFLAAKVMAGRVLGKEL